MVNEVNQLGRLVTSDLAARLGVSEVTIRADLEHLERRGRLSRTRGGAVPADSSDAIDAFDMRAAMRSGAKRSIALEAAEFIRGDQTVILDAGTTVHHLAQVLPEVPNLNVYTPALPLAQHLIGVEGVTVHMIGGRIEPSWLQTVGNASVQGIDDVTAHILFLGCAGVDEDLDMIEHSPSVAEVKQNLVRHARKVVLLADSAKMGRMGSTKVLPVGRVDTVITDDGITDDFRRRLAKLGVEVVVAREISETS
ncbi:DeoR family transcriptional regulator [Phycicoccus endophyticus]|nr:DeoR family transcriptional regulator [Phycicoccus endophyticus]